MKIIDISWPISSKMTTYKGKPAASFETAAVADHTRESTVTLSVHSGTHVDAPAHFLPRGETVDLVPLEKLIGPCVVLDMTQCTTAVTREDLEQYELEPEMIILLKTKN